MKGATLKVEAVEEASRIDELIQESQDKLVVIDLHAGWCGPCDALTPTLSKMMNEYEKADERITIASANTDKYSEKLQETLPAESNMSLEKNGCMPVFLVYRFGACISIIQGVDGPAIADVVDINIPQISAAE